MIARLSPQERAAVVLKDAFDLTLAEIAEALSTSVGAVKGALHRGRGKLTVSQPAVEPRGVTDEPARRVIGVFCDAFNARDLPRLAPDGNLDWFRTDRDFEDEMLALLGQVDVMLFGRVSYELLAEYWPTAGTASAREAPGGFSSHDRAVEFTRFMNTIPTIAYSKTLTSADWGPGGSSARASRMTSRP